MSQNFRIELKVVRNVTEANVRKKLNIPADAPVTRRNVEDFGRMWQNETAQNGEAPGLIECAEIEASVVFQ